MLGEEVTPLRPQKDLNRQQHRYEKAKPRSGSYFSVKKGKVLHKNLLEIEGNDVSS